MEVVALHRHMAGRSSGATMSPGALAVAQQLRQGTHDGEVLAAGLWVAGHEGDQFLLAAERGILVDSSD